MLNLLYAVASRILLFIRKLNVSSSVYLITKLVNLVCFYLGVFFKTYKNIFVQFVFPFFLTLMLQYNDIIIGPNVMTQPAFLQESAEEIDVE